jgi:hypothetical protein
MQRGDIYRPHCDYAAAGGDPGTSEHTSEATTDRYTNAPSQATDGSPGGMMTHRAGRH